MKKQKIVAGIIGLCLAVFCLGFGPGVQDASALDQILLSHTNSLHYLVEIDLTPSGPDLGKWDYMLSGKPNVASYGVAGNFFGDGKDWVIIRHLNGNNYLCDVVEGSWSPSPDLQVAHYMPGDMPGGVSGVVSYGVAGNFLGDGKDWIIIRHVNGSDYLCDIDPDTYALRLKYWMPTTGSGVVSYGVAGNFFGDGKDWIIILHANGNDYLCDIDVTTYDKLQIVYYMPFAASQVASYEVAGNFLGDGKDWIVIRHANGNDYLCDISPVDATYDLRVVYYIPSGGSNPVTSYGVAGDFVDLRGYNAGYADGSEYVIGMLPPGIRKNLKNQRGFTKPDFPGGF
ncbi:MAG: hypothetical protein HY606_13610 [Planctomycetes bacterium]|nr:hypothetical protein [Planctomycetota bacterium]